MQLLIGSPLGFWALLGIPILLVIHALQQRTTRTDCSTLFLLEDLAPESVRGPVLDALRPSWLLLLQLISVALLVWLLIDPRWVAADSKRVVAFVLDGSVSMATFREHALESIQRTVEREVRRPGTVEWALIDTRRSGAVLYRGVDRRKFHDALRGWEPTGGHHDYQPAIHYALEIAGREGLAIFVTDHVVPVPPTTALLAVGAPRDNCGFAGATVEPDTAQFSVVVRNYGSKPCERTLQIGERAEALVLMPGELKAVRGVVPATTAGVQLALDRDDFPIDDTLAVVRPERKLVRVAPPADGGAVALWWKRISGTMERIETSSSDADLAVGDRSLLEKGGNAIVFVETIRKDARLGRVFAEHHPLVDHLPWDDLRAVSIGDAELQEGDEPLVWSGDLPLFFLRPAAAGQQLIINLRPENSNLGRNSAFILLIHRYIELVRARVVGVERGLVETNQRLRLPPGSDRVTVAERSLHGASGGSRQVVRAVATAPPVPGTFTVSDSAGKELFNGAAYFAEVVEADLSKAASFDGTDGRSASGGTQRATFDPFTSLWLLLLLVVLLASWRTAAREGVL